MLDYAAAMTRTPVKVPDALFAALRAEFGEAQLVADRVVYGDHIPASYLLAMTAYAVAYAAILLLLTVLLFSRREFA